VFEVDHWVCLLASYERPRITHHLPFSISCGDMVRLVSIVVVAMMVGVFSLTAAAEGARAARHATPRCPGAHERVIVADAQAVVYQARLPREEGTGIYACAYGHRPYLLGRRGTGGPGGNFGVEGETLAGSNVAYEEEEVFPGGRARFVILVRDLRSGRVIREAPTGEANVPGLVGDGRATDLVVKSDGAVAWIVETEVGPTVGGTGPPTMFEVRAVDRTGSRLLASGSHFDPLSLALAGSTLYWTQEGQPFSAQLQ
jgi:hypothetical protein